MKSSSRKITLLFCSLCSLGFVGVAQAKYPIAGVKPHARPDGAPVIQKTEHDKVWFEQAMTGVETPYPKSLGFIKNQGNWYTPFANPGIPGPYDIRGWHK